MTEHNRDIVETATSATGWRRFLSFFRPAPEPSPAHRLYSALVRHARYPFYFRELEVPDTPEGRFEILALHVGLLIRRLVQDREKGGMVAQELVDLMVTDLDVNLRELGVGDLSVGKQVKRLAGQFNARLDVLTAAFDGDDHDRLLPMLTTNVYHGVAAPSEDHVSTLMRVCKAIEASLAGQEVEELAKGRIDLPEEQALRNTCKLA